MKEGPHKSFIHTILRMVRIAVRDTINKFEIYFDLDSVILKLS